MASWKMQFLGTAASAFSRDRHPTSILLSVGARSILLDCAEGVTKRLIDLGVDLRSIGSVYISHGHNDHLIGIVTFLWQNWLVDHRTSALEIIGPPYIHDRVRSLIEIASTPPGALSFPVGYTGSTCQAGTEGPGAPVMIETGDSGDAIVVTRQHARSIHEPECHAIRLDISRPATGFHLAICYSGDTSYSKDVMLLARKCDYLIHECTFLDEDKPFATRCNHSTPSTAALVAREAGVKTLVLVHYATSLEGNEPRMMEQASQGFGGCVLVARDLMSLEGPIN